MCGIVGAIRIAGRDTVQAMCDLIAYRGPDDEGLWDSGDVVLGHRRLSILDLTTAGHQPMLSDDGQVAIVFNGEIYNFPVVRDELEKLGHRFDSHSDTEVLLRGYLEWGEALLPRIEGIFAFGIWDQRDQSLLLARDRSGIKPLYFHQRDGGIAFGSEIKVFRLLPGFESRVNRIALRSALRFACNLDDETMLAGVFKVRPGELLRWRDGRVERRPYYDYPPVAIRAWDERELARELRARLERTIQSQMISDAPLGAALSGGLDSSGIVALMARAGGEVKTFTVFHGEDDPDLIAAREVAEHCKTTHTEIPIHSKRVADLAPEALWYLEEPVGQMESLQMFLNYQEAAQHVKVLLVGEGADELFGGYDRFRLFNPRLPLPRATRNALYQRVYMYADQQPKPLLARALARAAWGPLPGSTMSDPTPRPAEPPIAGLAPAEAFVQAMNHDQRTYLHELSLKRADATGMAHSLELRVPFLGREVIEIANTIPASMHLRNGVEKWILRESLRDLLPTRIVERRKRPFQMSLDTALTESLHLLSDRLLQPADVRARGFFDPAKVEALRHGRPGKRAPIIAHKVWSYRLWSTILCELWGRLFLDRAPDAGPPASLDEL